MDFSYTEDQQSLRELARGILEKEATHERLVHAEAGEERMDRGLWTALAKANLLGVAVAEEFGGSGLGLTELCLLFEELGRAVAPVPAYATLALGALPIAEAGTAEQRQKWLPSVVSGELLLTASLVETGDSETHARHEGPGWRLTGRRPLVPAAHLAHRILVPARSEEGALGFFLVDPRSEGVRLETVRLANRQRASNVVLQNARVPEAEVLGDPGRGEALRDWLQDRAFLALCALAVGIAERALEMTASYTTERRQFDRPIGSFQAVHQRAADAYVDLQAMKLTFWRALHLLEHGQDARSALRIARYWASEGSARITYAAQHLHGGIGVDTDYPLHRYYLWGTWVGIHLGSASEQLSRLGADLAA